METAVMLSMKSGLKVKYFTRELNLINLNAYVNLYNTGSDKMRRRQEINKGMLN